MSIALYFIMTRMQPPETKEVPGGHEAIRKALSNMGPMWGTVVLFGVGISLGTALLQTRAAAWLANVIVHQFGLQNMIALTILALMSMFLIVIHLDSRAPRRPPRL